MKRVFLIVLDSVGIGAMEDAKDYGDEGVNTLYSVSQSPFFHLPNLKELGLFNIEGINWTEGIERPSASCARMKEASKGKDTTIGHWEIAGVISEKPLPTFPHGFPKELLDRFSKLTGRKIICNKPFSGTEVINVYGDEHMKTGDLIVYTSADSVFQIAAHEDIVPIEELYRYCKIARELLTGDYAVGRVIARPFNGQDGDYHRTAARHDYSLAPPSPTMLDALSAAGQEVIGIGKIYDIFAGVGITTHTYTSSNDDGMEKLAYYVKQSFEGLCFLNLVDYDMLYGHRNDVDGYAKALTRFDEQLPEIMSLLGEEDMLMITADHGCDPGYKESTNHSREYTPLLMYRKGMKVLNYGTRDTFADIGATILDYLKVEGDILGKSLL